MSIFFDNANVSCSHPAKVPEPHGSSEPAPAPENRHSIAFVGQRNGTTDLTDLVKQLKEWWKVPGRELCEIKDIPSALLQPLKEEALKQGLKFKCDWSAKSNTALLRMASPLHDIPLINWLNEVTPGLRRRIRKLSFCEQCKIKQSLEVKVRLRDGSCLQPDAGYVVIDRRQKGLDPELEPRVVFELAYSQPREEVLDKAWRYLYESATEQQVHAVAVGDITYPMKDGELTEMWWDVWVREATDVLATDYPLDDCNPPSPEGAESVGRGSTEDEREEPSHGEPSVEGSTLSGGSQNLSWRSDEPTAVHETPKAPKTKVVKERGSFYSLTGTAPWMRRRNEKPLLIFREGTTIAGDDDWDSDDSDGDKQPDSAVEAGQEIPTLPLDAYDFLRTCRAKQHKTLSANDRPIPVNMTEMRRLTRRFVIGKRESELRKREPQPPPAPAPPSTGKSSEARPRPESPEIYGGNKRRKMDATGRDE